MRITRPISVIALFLFGGLLLTASSVRAETPLIEILKANPKWFGTVGEGNQLAVTFHVVGDSPALESITYRWEQNREREAVEFKLGNKNIEFMIPPEERNRWYKLVLTIEGTLSGSLTGLTRDKSSEFYNSVLLRPVSAAKGAVTELKGSIKHCSVPPDFAISDGKNLSPELKKFLGFFSGSWDHSLPHTLLVADITKDGTASIYYAWETYADWNINRPGCTRFKGKISDGVLTGTTRGGAKVKYWFSDPDTLNGQYDRRHRVTPGTFKRE